MHAAPIRIAPPISNAPYNMILRWLRAMNGATVWFGFAIVSTPMISSPRRIGAATCITVLLSSFGSLRVLRAPYSPRSVRYTSFQRE